MAYATPYEPTQPQGSDPAKDAPLDMRMKEAMMVERVEDLFGTDFTDDPMEITRLGHTSVAVDDHVVYEAEYNGGNSGSTKTLDLVANGTTQKFTLTASCVFTLPTAPAGTVLKLLLVQNATGGWTPTFSANVKYQAGLAPSYITTASTASILQAYSNGVVWMLSSAGTGFNVS